VLPATDVKKAATILGITWDEAWHIMERAVRRGRAAKGRAVPEIIGVHEKAIAKGHQYMTLVCDLEQATVEYIERDRKQASLQSYFDGFESEELEAVQAASMDMWPPYINACLEKIPGAEGKIVFDRFHIMRHVIDAVDMVRKREHTSTRRCWPRATPL
jgi:transposase